MPFADAGGVTLYYEAAGKGPLVIFVHGFAGDHRSWEPQVRSLSRLYRCVAFNARGYPPSDVPEVQSAYTQDLSADDVAAAVRHLKVEDAHVVGLSQGGFAALHFAMRHPRMTRSIVVAGVGYGSVAARRKEFVEREEAEARSFETEGARVTGRAHAERPSCAPFRTKDPRGWAEARDRFMEHSDTGSALTLRGLPKSRPTVYELEPRLKRIRAPTLIIAGDEDEWCLEPSLYLKRTIPDAGLWIFPKSGHTINLEERDRFNRACFDFFATVEATGRGSPARRRRRR